MILTEGEKMVLTPSYFVFDLYQDHQDAMLVDSFVETEMVGEGAYRIPALHESASLSENGRLTVTLANLSLETAYDIDAVLLGSSLNGVEATLLSGEMAAHNDFEHPQSVKPAAFSQEVRLTSSGAAFQIPPHSIVKLSFHA